MNKTQALFDYIKEATSPIQATGAGIKRLEAAGFSKLNLADTWSLESGGKYYLRPYPTTLIAFVVGKGKFHYQGYRIVTSHTDCPTFKVKPNPEIKSHAYVKLNTEVYGGPIFASFYDRPLSLAGHVVLRSDDMFNPRVVEVDFDKALMTIPSLAIHFNREVNKGVAINPQKDMLPLLEMIEEDEVVKDRLLSLLAKEIGCDQSEILDYDLYVYVREQGEVVGVSGEFASVPRVDNLASVYASLDALMAQVPEDGIAMAACFDNEEIGSMTKQGADSMLLSQIVSRIDIALFRTPEMANRYLQKSFIISADGAHGVHPNAPEVNDISNFPLLNKGVVLKVSAKQSYSTDGVSGGVFKQICEKAGVPYQVLVNRSDQPGGKTLGPIASRYLAIPGVDIGLPMLAMHSARELYGTKDMDDMVKVLTTFYQG